MAISPCCCISLRKGTLIIAFLEVIFNAFVAITTGLSVGALMYLHAIDSDGLLMRNITEEMSHDYPDWNEMEPTLIYVILNTILMLLCFLCLLQVLFAFMLISGVRKERHILVKYWLIFKGSCMVLSVFFILCSAGLKGNKRHFQNYHANSQVVTDVGSVILSLYFLFVVHQYYETMQARRMQIVKPKLDQKSEYA